MDPRSQTANEAQDEREWELADEELDRLPGSLLAAFCCPGTVGSSGVFLPGDL